jgi:hypothetical protein
MAASAMRWKVEVVQAFSDWFDSLGPTQREDVLYSLRLLEDCGPQLEHPHSSAIKGSRHGHMRELRIFYAFDPRRMAILLIGGDKSGDKRFYETMVPLADRLYDRHLRALEKEKGQKK